MNRDTQAHELLKAFLMGLGQRSRDALAFVARYEGWLTLASREIERRAMAMLAGLSDEDLAAIVWKEVDLCEIAEQVLAEIGEE